MTYSIVAHDETTGEFGVAVASRFFAVGALVPHIRAGKGAVATQAFVSPIWGINAADRLAAGEAAPPTVHLATGIPTSLGALAKAAIATAGSGSGIEVLPARSFDVKGFCGTPERAAEVLGWRAGIALDEGLARLAQAMRVSGAPKPVTMPGH